MALFSGLDPRICRYKGFIDDLNWSHLLSFQKDLQKDFPSINKLGAKREMAILMNMHHCVILNVS